MIANRTWFWKGSVLAGVLLGFAAGGAVGWSFRTRGGSAQLQEWQRYDAVRDAARWAFLAANDDVARGLLRSHLEMLDRCTPEGYPCRGRLRIESYLFLAALEEEADREHAWIERAQAECSAVGGNSRASCSENDVRNSLKKLRATRGTAGSESKGE